MNHQSEQFDNLDALFNTVRRGEAYLPDNGFSDQVMASLPNVGSRELANWKKNTLLLTSAALGSVIAATTVPAFSLPVGDTLTLLTSMKLGSESLLAIASALFGLSGIAIWANRKELI